MHTIILFIFVILLAFTGAYARNDWNEPCISGVCQYDLDPSSSSGTLKIWGPHTAISDVTLAAGWHILECDEDATEQEIRLICISPSAPCSHLFSDAGPKDKIVRLPEWCGANPFARVAEVSVSTDQTLPPEFGAEFWKRDGHLQRVFTLRLDTNFHYVDFKGTEPVSFAIQAATIPDIEHNLDTHAPAESGQPAQRTHADIVSRSLESIKKSIEDRYKKVEAAVTDRVKDVKEDIEHGKAAATAGLRRAKKYIQSDKAAATHDIERARNIREDKAVATHAFKRIENFKKDKASVTGYLERAKNNVKNGLKSANVNIHKDVDAGKATFQKVLKQAKQPLHVTKNITFGPTSMTRNMTLFKQTINCPPLYPGLEIDLNPDIHVEGTIGIVVVGTIVPPHVSNFSSITNLSANVSAVVTITADIAAVLDTGRISIFEVGLPGMDIPGILSLGPKFVISLQSRFTVDISVGVRIGIGYNVKNAQIYFPPRPGHQGSVEAVGLNNSPLDLKATPNVQGYVQLEGKIIPSISLGLSLFKNDVDIAVRAETTLYLNLQLEEDGKTQKIKKRETRVEPKRREVRFSRRSGNHDLPPGTRTVDKSINGHGYGRSPTKTSTIVRRSYPSPMLRKRGGGGGGGGRGLSPGPQATAGGRGPPAGMNTTLGHQFRGCFQVRFQLDLNVGTDSELFGIFDRNTKYSFYKKTWDLWEKCFGPPPYKADRESLGQPAFISSQFTLS
ncbi:hypothetical protein F5887DRAFT_1074902 [Amanita rubescens]|nr:hypothetical protein F5887DRAFT_1074902 [Amanita rubescens]